MISLTAFLVLGFILTGCDISRDNTPTPTNVPTPAPTPAPTPEPTATPTPTNHQDAAEEGHQLFIATGCSACHGQDAEGSSIAPALAGHTAVMVERQVRSPIGAMPAFSTSTLSDEELGEIIEFIESLEGAHGHVAPADIDREVALHHWMALLAIQVDDIPEAMHHVAHINALVTGEHLRQMEEVLTMLEGGQLHDAEHTIEGMLAGTAVIDLTPEAMHLQLALASVGVEDVTNAIHHTEHFLDLATDQQREAAEEILDLLQAENFREAEHELEELLGEGQ
ncbi:MAG: cytochrome c [Dehalococcoidia bacterium]